LDRKIKPEPEGEIEFLLPEIEKFRLKNGLKVLFVKKNSLPILKLNLVADSGSKFDPAGKKGLSNLFARTIDEGAGVYNSVELSDEFDLLGTNFSINCFSDDIHFSLQTLSENIERSLELFSMVLTNPHFSEKAFNKEKRKTLTTIQQLKDSSEDIADLAFDYLVFGNLNPYAFPTIGYMEDLEKITINDLKKFYQSNFCPLTSSLIVVGNIEKNELEEKLNSHLALWTNKSSVENINFSEGRSDFSINLIHKKDAVQSEIRIGHVTEKRTNENFFSRHLLNTILGGQFTSRINLNLREDKGYTYGAVSRFNYLKELGNFYVSTSVGSENTGNAVKEIISELELIKKGITLKELEFAKDSITHRFPGNFETYSHIAANLISLVLHSLPNNYFDNYLRQINNTTKEDIDKSALEFIKSEELKILVVGNKNIIKKQLDGLNKGEIIELNNNGQKIN